MKIVEKKNSNGKSQRCLLLTSISAAGCSKKQEQVVIYSDADEEAVEAMKQALDNNGYQGKYISSVLEVPQSWEEKLLAGETNLEARYE